MTTPTLYERLQALEAARRRAAARVGDRPTLYERLQDLEAATERLSAAPSPTGSPLLSPRAARALVAGLMIAIAVVAGLAASYPECRALDAALTALSVVAALLGIASPGLRRAPVVLFAVLALGGCTGPGAHVRLRPGWQTAAAHCVLGELSEEATAVLPDVVTALSGEAVDWQPQLDAVVARAGSAALCALVAIISAIELGGQGGGEGAEVLALSPTPQIHGMAPVVLLIRGQTYLSRAR